MSTLPPDPYKLLGVSKDAQLPEIRSAHRKLVLKCHPDKVQDPTLKAQKQDEFQKVQQAYELLSDENERAKYDDNVKLAELRKEMAKGMSANTSAPRAPSTRTFDVRTAEPRPDTFKTTYRPSPGTKMYSQYNSRSWDEEIHSRSNSIFEEPRARRAASYEKPSRQDDDGRERERERERERRRKEDRDREREELARAADRRDRERERERERQADKKAAEKAAKRAAEEKEARRQERKRQEKAEKEREKERRREAEDKARRQKPAYIEPYDDEPTYVAKSDKKKSSSTKEKEKDKRARSIPRDGVPLREEPAPPVPLPPPDLKSKITETMLFAASYMDQSRKTGTAHPGLSRSQTYDVRYAHPIAVPTPPAAAPYVVPPPPIPTEEDAGRRSKSRRSSETKTRDKSSHKKSSPTKEAPVPVPPSPNVVDASPSGRHMPQFASATSSPTSTSPPKYLNRSATFNDGFSRPPPGPVRSQTFQAFSHVPADADLRGRGRSRLQSQIVSEDSESEDDRRHHRSHRHKTHSPEPMSADYGGGQRTRYMVSGGRAVAVPVEPAYHSYHDESPPSRKHSKAAYYDPRPPMPSREASYSSSASPYFPKVKTARYDDVQYTNIPHRYRSEDVYAQ